MMILILQERMIKEIILHEDIAKEYLEKRSKLSTKKSKKELAEEYYPNIIKEYKNVSS